jgi:hypothetical protein
LHAKPYPIFRHFNLIAPYLMQTAPEADAFRQVEHFLKTGKRPVKKLY